MVLEVTVGPVSQGLEKLVGWSSGINSLFFVLLVRLSCFLLCTYFHTSEISIRNITIGRKNSSVRLYIHGNEFYKTQFRIVKRAKCNLVTAAKCNYYKQKIQTCKNDSAKLYGLSNGLLGK